MKYESIITHNLFKFSTSFAIRFLAAYRRCKGSRIIILRNSTLNGHIFPLVSEHQLPDSDSLSSDSGQQSGDSGVQSGESEEESEDQSFKSFPLWKKYRNQKRDDRGSNFYTHYSHWS